jgi:lysine 2,3-aminomutase
LLRAGVPVNNQAVLLKGVNDEPEVMLDLCRSLFRARVRPYYLYQCDLTRGVEHFRTPINRGIEIMEYLRGRLGGLAIPQYIVDAPHGGGKIPVGPTYIVSASPTHTVLRNYEGLLVSYPEPAPTPITSPLRTPHGRQNGRQAKRPPGKRRGGVAGLASGHQDCIVPVGSDRIERRRHIDHGRSARFRPERFAEKKILADIAEIVQVPSTDPAPPNGNGTPPSHE